MHHPVKLGILSSFNTKCGISEYSRYLVKAFQKRDDIDVTVFGSKNYDSYKVGEDESYVLPTFGVLPWNNYGDHSFDYNTVLEHGLDVLHVQYEVVLYNQEPFGQLLTRFDGIKAITYHDNCIPPSLPYSLFDLQYSHRDDVGVGNGFVIPMGIEDRKPLVKTFGLGRSRYDIIGDVCKENGWKFEYSFGEKNWVGQEDLYSWLREADLIVLYYDEVDAAGTSIAARVALSTRRPVIVNDVTWFKDLKLDNKHLYKVEDINQLQAAMKTILHNPRIEGESWDVLADIHTADYKKALENV